MGRVLIIAEKPDQGRTLASPFQVKKRNGFLEIVPNELFPDGAYVTWAIGHLTQLVNPEKYNATWKAWRLETLPMIPEQFQYEIAKGKYKQFQMVKNLLRDKEVTSIIHAGDAGREGELIVRNIIHLSGVRKPMKRLWISSLTKKAIVEGFQSLKTEEATRSLYYEAYTRACADWLVGMNASRIYTILLKQKGMNDVFSVGRVQTPTLALIVKREREIENFQSEPFWEVKATFQMGEHTYEGVWHKDGGTRIKKEELAKKIAMFCMGKEASISELKKERKEYQPPLLFNLSALQATANKRYKFPPKKTLDILQKLYQRGIVSYPRSDSNYVTKGEAAEFPSILQKLAQYQTYNSLFPVPQPNIIYNKRFVNEKKVSDHYAVIPTEQVVDPKSLAPDEEKIYDLVVRRLIATHYQNAIVDYTTIQTLVDGRATFVSKGKQQIEAGWRKVIMPNEKEKDDLLPNVQEGETGNVSAVAVKEGKTEPPKRYTEGQLITLMKTAGKFIDNEELEKVLIKTEGLGTEATRAGIITMLKDREYILVQKNLVFAMDKAKVLVDAIGEKVLASPEMTAKWELRLEEIGAGKASPASFMEQTKKLTTKIIDDAKQHAETWDFKGIQIEGKRTRRKKRGPTKLGVCPKCQKGQIVDKGNFYGCNDYTKTKCSFTLSKTILGKRITQAHVKQLCQQGKTDVIKGLKKREKQFDAMLMYNKGMNKIEFSFKK
ncbi:DNA topoisomerase III [Massilibacterium senegalense]|uniref:DNA topoisomerase III n=1 Tax=Massilibacterium senegalense TaxID=1632858 RepID=UPI000784A4D0|nr:DNA topoisomerase III [Massilibacterium senegalense]